MRKPLSILRLLSAGLLMGALLAPSLAARAGTLYRWVTEDGVVAYTDDARRIPERYRDAAQSERAGRLDAYARLTPADAAAARRHAERLDTRLERLRKLNAPATRASASSEGPTEGARVTLRAGAESRPNIELNLEGDAAPVVVEVERRLDADSLSTRHVTVVRQGDRVLSVVSPRSRMAPPSSGFIQDLEGLR